MKQSDIVDIRATCRALAALDVSGKTVLEALAGLEEAKTRRRCVEPKWAGTSEVINSAACAGWAHQRVIDQLEALATTVLVTKKAGSENSQERGLWRINAILAWRIRYPPPVPPGTGPFRSLHEPRRGLRQASTPKPHRSHD